MKKSRTIPAPNRRWAAQHVVTAAVPVIEDGATPPAFTAARAAEIAASNADARRRAPADIARATNNPDPRGRTTTKGAHR